MKQLFKLGAIAPLVLIVVDLACSHIHPPSCTVTCQVDVDCLDGQTCSSLGRCTGTGTCSCTPSELFGCADATTAIACNSSGDGIASTACGSVGCNASTMRCNQCAPSAPLCEADGRTLDACDASGIPQTIETCALGCVAGSGSASAHCAHVVPPYVPDVCDALASAATLSLTGTIDPGVDMSCSAIVPQAGGPDVCVLRADSIHVSGALVVAGPTGSDPSRPIAIVADHDLIVDGTIDLSAHGVSPGPGGNAARSGTGGSGSVGGGGAGSFTAGGNGADGQGGVGGLGGAPIAPPVAILAGGAGAGSCPGLSCASFGGGGGGGLLLVSCEGSVLVSGVVIASGGGGQGAHLSLQGVILPPEGGGAGGNVSIAGGAVTITGSFFANGGGGGGGCNGQAAGQCPGGDGGDGRASTTVASGGASGIGSPGGGGGTGTITPGNGATSGLIPPGPGGAGGGAAGHFQIYVPQGGATTIAPVAATPPFDPTLVVQTR